MKSYISKLQEAGQRITPTKRKILDILISLHSPICVDELFETLHEGKMKTHYSTVFRILESFSDAGVASRINFGDGKIRYEITGNHHHHLVCTECGKTYCIELDKSFHQIHMQAAAKHNFLVESHRIDFFGRCKNCYL